ncbi:MAG: hypothetical protein U0414_09310 [Polyangiaceae bacterium]
MSVAHSGAAVVPPPVLEELDVDPVLDDDVEPALDVDPVLLVDAEEVELEVDPPPPVPVVALSSEQPARRGNATRPGRSKAKRMREG